MTDLCDTFTIDGVRRTSDGYLAATARVARTGIQIYKGSELGRSDLDQVRVYRPPEEVFHEDALKSFAHRPVTLRHPPVPVTAKNWKRFSGGQTGDEVVRDGEYVRVPMVMMDAALISAYERGEASQLSMGYSTDIQWRTGVVDSGPDKGQHYDAVQTAIRGNHLAVVPVARGGDQLRVGDSFRDLVEQMNDEDLDDAWSDEARAAALEARRSIRHHDNMAEKHVQKAYFQNTTPSETKEHSDISKEHAIASHHYTRAHAAFKNGEMKEGEQYAKYGKKAGVKADRMSGKHGIKDSSPSDDDDYDCPECGAEVPSGEGKCPECGHKMNNTTNDGEVAMKVIMIDSVPVNVADDQGAAIIERHVRSLLAQVADAGSKLADATASVAKSQTALTDATASVSAKDGEIAVLKKQVADAAITPERLDALVKDRMSVIDAATPLLDKTYVFDGKTVEAIRRAAVEAYLGDAAKGMDDGAVAGAFVAASARVQDSRSGSQQLRQAMFQGGRQPVQDARATALDEATRRTQDAWKTAGRTATA